ncbi:MAG: sigma-70 family RNA polymerase sigma factor [Candidatus Omnitrophota bacterium]
MKYASLVTSLLIGKCAQKDPLAWAEFVKRFTPLVTISIKRALFKYSADTGVSSRETDDIRQDLFMSLWNKDKLSQIINRDNIDYWIAIIARNAAISHLRKIGKDTLMSDGSFFDQFSCKESEKRLDNNDEKNCDKTMEEIYTKLTDKEKIVFKLTFVNKMSLKDIAKMLSIPIGTVSSSVTRMRQKIKREM